MTTANTEKAPSAEKPRKRSVFTLQRQISPGSRYVFVALFSHILAHLAGDAFEELIVSVLFFLAPGHQGKIILIEHTQARAVATTGLTNSVSSPR